MRISIVAAGLLTAGLVAAGVATPAAAQGRYVQVRQQVQTKTVEGEVKGMQGTRLIVEIDGQTGPIPVDRNTRLTVSATGDKGFLRPGAVVVVSGTLRPDGTVAGASFVLHPNAQQTITPTARKVNASDPQVTVAGSLVSLDPFVIRTIDPIAVVRPEEGNVGAWAPGGIDVSTANAKKDLMLTVKLRDGVPPEIPMDLGGTPGLIAEGDWAYVTFASDNPSVARAVRVRKAEPLKSAAPESEAKPAGRKGRQMKTDGDAADGGAAEGGAAEGTGEE